MHSPGLSRIFYGTTCEEQMKSFAALLLYMMIPAFVAGQQQPAGSTLNLSDLVSEALRNNPELLASMHEVDAAHERVHQAGALDDPELMYMQEGFPGLRFNEAMFSRIELSQMIRFPSKLSAETEIAEIDVEHSHHNRGEKELQVIEDLKSAYFELWYAQRAISLNRENARLLQQFVAIAKTKFGVGDAALQDVLKASVELAKLENQATVLHQQEKSAKAMLAAILNRQPGDTLGTATLTEQFTFTPTLDTLQRIALEARPMLQHDSSMVEESRAMLSLSKSEYLPDIKLAVQYMTAPIGDFRGWAVSAGITLPFAPWTLRKADSRVDEATATIAKSQETYLASRNMVLSNIAADYARIQSAQHQLNSYRAVILPQARMSLKASMTAYQTAGTDFLMLIDAYRTLVDLTMESLMVRMQFEQAVAELERQVGVQNIAGIQ